MWVAGGERHACWQHQANYGFSMAWDKGWGAESRFIGRSDRALCSSRDTPRAFLGAALRETDTSHHEDRRPFVFQALRGSSQAPMLSLAVPAHVSQQGDTQSSPWRPPQQMCPAFCVIFCFPPGYPHFSSTTLKYPPITSSDVPSLSLRGHIFPRTKSDDRSWS